VFVKLLGSTWRLEMLPSGLSQDVAAGKLRGVFAFWHCHILTLLHSAQCCRFSVPVSEHTDGEYVAQVMFRMGLVPVRGSSTRGGVKALRGIIKASRAGCLPAITPDGPKGPRHTVQPGIVYIAAATRLPVIPLGVFSSKNWVLPSWDGFEIPKPRSRIVLAAGEPVSIPERVDRARMGEYCARIKEAMDRAALRAADYDSP